MKLRYKLPLYYGVVGVICIILFGYLSFNSKELIVGFIQNRFDESARNIQDNVDSFIDERVKDLTTIIKHGTLNQFLKKEERNLAQNELDNFLFINNTFNYIEVIDKNKTILLRSDIVRRDKTNNYYLIKSESLKHIGNKSNNLENIDKDIYLSNIINNDFNEESINIILTTKQGLIIKGNLNLNFIHELVNDNSIGKKALFEIKDDNKNNIFIIKNAIIDDTENNIFKGISPSRYNGWRLDLEQRSDEAYLDIKYLLNSFWLIMAYIIITIIILIVIIDKNFSHPITRLLKTVKKISDTNNINYDYKQELDLTRKDEIGSLANSFDKMIKNIKGNVKILNEYKGLIDESSLVSKFDTKGKITYINDKFCEISSYTRKELIGKNISIIKHDKISNINYDDIWSNLKIEKSWTGSIKYFKKSGEAYWVSMIVAPLFDINNSVIEYISIGNDITELERTKEELNDSYNKLQDSTTQLIEKERIGKEFELAEQIQNDFLPKVSEVNIKGLQTYFGVSSATEIGGDLYDVLYYESNPNKALFYIGDVTGHGLISGMMMAICNTLMYGLVKQYSNMVDIFKNLNTTLYNKLPGKLFITMLMLEYDIDKGTFSYFGAGHEKIFIYRKKLDLVEEIKSGGSAIGMFKTTTKELKSNTLEIASGDIILLYTDGIPEARNKKGEFYGIDKFKESFKSNAHREVDILYKSMEKDLTDFVNGVEFADDVTMFIIKKD